MTTIDTFMTVFIKPLIEIFSTVFSFVLPLLSVFIILLLGYFTVKLLQEVLQRVFKAMRMEKWTEMFELSKMLKVGGLKYGLSHGLISIVSLIVVLSFVIIAMRLIGVDSATESISLMIMYVTHVVSAVFVLIVGHILAKIVGRVIFMVVSNLQLPNPKLHERVARWAIILYAIKLSLTQLNFGYLFSGVEFRIWFAGVVLAFALAFGLGGRDAAAKWLVRKSVK